jgi:hypothetical protein
MKKLTFDKKLHLAFGAFIGLCTMLIAKDYGHSQNSYVGIGALSTVFVAIAKEVYDKATGKGTFEKLDIFWTIFGGFSLILIYEFIKDVL